MEINFTKRLQFAPDKQYQDINFSPAQFIIEQFAHFSFITSFIDIDMEVFQQKEIFASFRTNIFFIVRV